MTPLQDMELPEGDGETIHLNPAAEFYPNILLPGDPARAMSIAIKQLTEPRMFNHRRGLWGYSGLTPEGEGFLVQATGMGGPSAAIVAEELCDLGAEILVRVGTCGAINPSVKLGDLVVASAAIADDGTSKALGASHAVLADRGLFEALAEHANASGRATHEGRIATVDLFYDPNADGRHESLLDREALAIEMEAAAVFAVAKRRGVRAACLLGVTDELHGDVDRVRMTHDEITELGDDLGSVGVAAILAVSF
ncbi:MAG: purine-nucleoside phosphorylase [Solirubrobacterales bacterium]